MDDLISRAALNIAIEEEYDGVCVYDVSGSTVISDFQTIVDMQPAVDAAPVVHGRWQDWHRAWLVCDQCNEKMLVRKSNHGYIQEFPHNYCPNCGAKMDKKI